MDSESGMLEPGTLWDVPCCTNPYYGTLGRDGQSVWHARALWDVPFCTNPYYGTGTLWDVPFCTNPYYGTLGRDGQ